MNLAMRFLNQLICICVFALLFIGCGRAYPEVSPTAYKIASALHNVSDRKSEEGLAKIDDLIETSAKASEITPEEAEILTSICELGRQKKWKDAKAQARQLMLDQTDL